MFVMLYTPFVTDKGEKHGQTISRYILTDTSLFDQATKSMCKFLFDFFSVTQIITMNYRDVGCVSTLGNDCVVAYSEENGQWKLNWYNLRSGERVSCTVLEGTLSIDVQLVGVTFNDQECLALSHR